jgi:mono/diheme cytochrome c family protein
LRPGQTRRFRVAACTILLALTTLAGTTARVAAQPPQTLGPDPRAGRSDAEIYANACANCHGLDGRGSPKAAALMKVPVPDFTDCSFATREPDADWGAIIHQGGPVRGFDPLMPAFGEALSADEIVAVLRHVRTFCTSAAWPRGELNLPRTFFTEKAYPEDEAVWTTSVALDGPGSITNEIVYERRFGARNQFELKVPLAASHEPAGWRFGSGDITLGIKRAVAHSLARGSILSIAGEVILPTGDESAGAGSGTTVLEGFVSFGQMLPRDSFVQAQAGLEAPVNRDRGPREGFWRVAFGRTWAQNGGFGRAWTPMVELLAGREFTDGARTEWDVAPQVQVSLNSRQHVLLAIGVRTPVTLREGRSTRLMVYVLWDWFDGGLFDGW